MTNHHVPTDLTPEQMLHLQNMYAAGDAYQKASDALQNEMEMGDGVEIRMDLAHKTWEYEHDWLLEAGVLPFS